MAKYGDNNGSNRVPQPQVQASLNGFRLDSTQSSWLMDRLEALSEEEKISVAAEADRLAEQHKSSQPPTYQDNPGFQGEVPGHMHGQHKGPYLRQGEHMQTGAGGGEGGPYGGGSNMQPGAEYQAAGPDGDDGANSDVSARQLKEKIESLEQQLAEISTLTNRARMDHVDGTPQEGEGQDPGLNPGMQGDLQGYAADYAPEQYGQDIGHDSGQPQGYYQDPRAAYEPHHESQGGYFDDNYVPPQEWSSYETKPDKPKPEGAVYRGMSYDPDKIDKDKAREVIAKYQAYLDEEETEGADTYATSQNQNAGQARVQYPAPYAAGHGQAELPQFLTPMPDKKTARSGLSTMIFGGVAAVVVAGIAYSYFSEGVTDIVKTDFGTVAKKQDSKLSVEKSPVVEKAEIAAPPKVQRELPEIKPVEKAVVAVSPADLASDFGVSKLVGTAGEEAPLIVRLPQGDYPSAFMVVKDLPEWARLNKGRLVNGAWILGFSDLADLKVFIPEDQPGTFTFTMEFVHSAEEEPIQRTVTAEIDAVVVQPVTPPKAEVEPDVASLEGENSEAIKTPEGVSAPGTLIIDQALEEKWLERGTRLLRAGDVAAARLAFSHLADQGSGRGAMAMAMTFDPNQPSSRVVAGIVPDVKRARFWYKRAISLGNDAARDPLRMLEGDK